MKNISNLYKEIADKYNVTPETVAKIESHVFAYIAEHMKERKPGPILIHNFGTFCPSLNKTNREIRKQLALYRTGCIERDVVVKNVKKLWVLRNEALKQNSE